MIKTYSGSIRQIVLFFLLIGIGSKLFSQTHTRHTVTINSNCGGYYEYLPYNYNASDQKYPIIFYLHSMAALGSGSNSDLDKILYEGIPYYINQNKFPSSFTVNDVTTSFIVISPQFKEWPKAYDVKTVIDYILSQNYKIDPSRIYVTGYSMGGDATFKYATSGTDAAGRLAAIATGDPYIYPYSDNGSEYIAGTNLAVSAFHSNDDSQAPATWSINYVNKINSYNPDVKAKLTLFDGYDHPTAWEKIYNPDWRNDGYNLYEWFLNYQRDGGGNNFNHPPVADAGNNKTIYLPTNSVGLKGDGSNDVDGQVTAYQWQKVYGPSSYTFNNASVANPTVSNLVAGTYKFQLTVTDNGGATDKDTVRVVVKDTLSYTESSGSVTRYIRVNVYGGVNPYNNSKWNNWNLGTAETTNISSGTLKYSDGTTSGISAVLSHSQSVGDNRDTYSGGMAPAEVLRYTSYSQLPRTLTISGLSGNKKYNIELYASRYSVGNSTDFTINGVSKNIDVYDNYNNKASFTNLTPDAQGQIVVGLKPGTNYTHLNGFMITEQAASTTAQNINEQAVSLTGEEMDNKTTFSIHPNPVHDQLTLQLNSKYNGRLKVQIIDMSGIIRKEFSLIKNQQLYTHNLPVSNLPKGNYIISLMAEGNKYVKQIIKL